MLVKVLGREALVSLPVELPDPFRFRLWHPLRRWLAKPTIGQPALALLPVTAPPSPERAFRHPQQSRSLQLAQPTFLPTSENVPEFQHAHTVQNPRPLHRSLPLGKRPSRTGQIVCYIPRTDRVLPTRL